MTPESLDFMESLMRAHDDLTLNWGRMAIWREVAMHFADHERLRKRIRRSAGLPAGNMVTGAFRRPVRGNQRNPRS